MREVEFGSLFRFIRNGMNVKQDKSGDGIPITRIETIANASVDASRVGFAGLAEEDCRGWFMEPGDILFSHINSVEHVGKCAVYQGIPEKLVHGMNLLCLRCDDTKITPEFAKYLIRGKARSIEGLGGCFIILTPASTVEAFRNGYRPDLHPSALS